MGAKATTPVDHGADAARDFARLGFTAHEISELFRQAMLLAFRNVVAVRFQSFADLGVE